jgi:dienelactone hydrolase
MRHALLLLLALAGPATAERPAALHRLPEPAGLARLVLPEGTVWGGLVILLPDALGEDGRSEPYVDSLLARGIATLALGLGQDQAAGPAEDPAATPQAARTAIDWAETAGFAPSRIGLLGFGLGGRAALAAAGGLPAVALYPGCPGLALPGSPALVLVGEAAAAGCAALPVPPGVTLRLIPGAGHGWDAPGAMWPSPGPLLPDPAGGPRLRASADHAVTLLAAEAAADWFEAHLASPPAGVARARADAR